MNYSTNTCQSCQVTMGGGRLLGLINNMFGVNSGGVSKSLGFSV